MRSFLTAPSVAALLVAALCSKAIVAADSEAPQKSNHQDCKDCEKVGVEEYNSWEEFFASGGGKETNLKEIMESVARLRGKNETINEVYLAHDQAQLNRSETNKSMRTASGSDEERQSSEVPAADASIQTASGSDEERQSSEVPAADASIQSHEKFTGEPDSDLIGSPRRNDSVDGFEAKEKESEEKALQKSSEKSTLEQESDSDDLPPFIAGDFTQPQTSMDALPRNFTKEEDWLKSKENTKEESKEKDLQSALEKDCKKRHPGRKCIFSDSRIKQFFQHLKLGHRSKKTGA